MTLNDKIYDIYSIARLRDSLPRPIVFTNGVFDLLHRGHVYYLEEASKLGASLVVAINSDASARGLNKGADRPLNNDIDRAYVLAGLSSVTAVTMFEAQTPLDVIKEIRPEVYVKGGDYDMETLTETSLVRSWGGDAYAIPFVAGFSTTSLVHRIMRGAVKKAVFLDRDGVINVDKGYIYKWEDFEYMPRVVDGLKKLQRSGFSIVVVTNQSGIARGYYTQGDYEQLNSQFLESLEKHDIRIDGVYHCPHFSDGNVSEFSFECNCRKPKPGMLFRAARELNLKLSESVLVGDKLSDIAAARAAGLKAAYLIGSGREELDEIDGLTIKKSSDLFECVLDILEQVD